MASTVHAAEQVGRVIAVAGTVEAIDEVSGQARTLAFDDAVYPGDTVTTSENGRIQIRFNDDALVALAPDSRFEIERYEESGDASGSVLMHLIEGALRTITGAIGKEGDDQYEMKTPVATIGIRGTEYSLDFCAASCLEPDRRPGLYGRVDDGEITVSTEVDSGAFGMGEYFYVAGSDSMPQPISTPPRGLRFNPARDGGADSGADGGPGNGKSAPPHQGGAALPEPAAPRARNNRPADVPGRGRQEMTGRGQGRGPGHGGAAPGHSGAAAGHGGEAPGNSANSPGHGPPGRHPHGGPPGRENRP